MSAYVTLAVILAAFAALSCYVALATGSWWAVASAILLAACAVQVIRKGRKERARK